uniref:Uncharacterized protein n=1 Tax=Vitis vinifera TaxID=29760 RepID=A5C9D9_VITVI|nr:hypothetical protein VITISV_004875 [Vitis vinifera]
MLVVGFLPLVFLLASLIGLAKGYEVLQSLDSSSFLSPKQSEIEESSLESLSKSRIQGVWDPAHYTRLRCHLHPAAATFHPAAAAITPGCQKLYTRLPKALHLATATFHPAAAASTRMYCIRNSDAGWERRAFQLLWIYISGSSNSTHPEDFTAILHSAAVFS